MPIYEYRCSQCGDEIEAIQKFSDKPLRSCEKCGGRLEKLLSRSAFMLKGGGWYADGYKKGAKEARTTGSKASTADGSSSSASSASDKGGGGATGGGASSAS